MAKASAAWGIDIGQCGLKALRCRVNDKEPGKVLVDAFDYIEYPKILSQPEAEPDELVRDALKLFLSRNELRGNKISVSVSGQSGLARFIKLPPVETKKIPDIVRYEANQQIPFDLEDVIWDYQRMFGGSEEDGFALETEVGLFAMKRDQVYQEIEPYREVGIDIDVVQLTPLAIYNYIVFDRLTDLPPEDEFDPDEPPESMVVLSIGTEATDLVITNGFRVWQRSVPLGGSHFTKALVKELQLTYAKAEHLKRNATQAEDPKAIYQAMRPVFKDLLTEIQRSIGYFHSLDRAAKIGKVVAFGNSMKLPGLKRYLSQNLGEEIHEVTELPSLFGPAVTESPAFKENIRCYGVAYGLALQAIGLGRLKTNLVPKEIVRDRIINRKKPWGVAAAVLLALGCLINFLLLWWPWSQVRIDYDGDEGWKSAKNAAQQVEQQANAYTENHNKAKQTYEKGVNVGRRLVAHLDARADWLVLCKAVSAAIQVAPAAAAGEAGADPADPGAAAAAPADAGAGQLRGDPRDWERLWLTEMRAQYFADVGGWFNPENERKFNDNRLSVVIAPPPDAVKKPAADPGILPGVAPREVDTGPQTITLQPPVPRFSSAGRPSGPGYVIELKGYHFHNSKKHGGGANFVRRTLCFNLQDKEIEVTDVNGDIVKVPLVNLGISHPLVFQEPESVRVELPNPAATGPNGQPQSGVAKNIQVTQYRFIVQFVWQPKPIGGQPNAQVAQVATP